MAIFAKLLIDRTGATAVEYALIATFISIVAIVGMEFAGDSINAMFEWTNSQLVRGAKNNGIL